MSRISCRAPVWWPRWRQLAPHVLAATADEAATSVAAPDTAWLLEHAGIYLGMFGSGPASQVLLERALGIYEALDDPNSLEVAGVLISLAVLLADSLGMSNTAEPLVERALGIYRDVAPDHPAAITAITWLGYVQTELGRPEAGRRLLEQAVERAEATHGTEDATVATALNLLGIALTDLQHPDTARPLLERALHIRTAIYGPDDLWTAPVMTNLGRALGDLGELDAARELLEHARRIRQDAHGSDSFEGAFTLTYLGPVLANLGDLAAARTVLEHALQVRKTHHGPEHPWTGRTAANLGRVLARLGDPDARPILELALHVAEATYGRTNYLTTRIQNDLRQLDNPHRDPDAPNPASN
jgi:tetratricopeptide (TPR) repeat protein